MADVIIRDVMVVDGTGAPAFAGDVSIAEGRIDEVGTVTATAETVVDGAGQVLAPGFVDVHTHDDGALLEHPDMGFKVSQGCTSVVVGNCGFSAIPAVEGEITKDLSGITAEWADLEGFRATVEGRGVAVNAVMLAGHNSIRSLVMGGERRAPTDAELAEMRGHVELAMEQGACGFSTGLIYRPGRWAATDELIELATAAAPYGGIYATHMRNEADRLLEAVDEALAISQASGLPLQISHHKASREENWGMVPASLAKVDAANEAGADVTLDMYPYTAGSGPMIQYFNLDDPDPGLAARIQLATCPPFRHYEGRMLADIAEEQGLTLPEAVRHVLTAPEGDRTLCIQHVMHEDDIVANLRHPLVMIGSDGLPELEGMPHPRLFGTFPRVLGHYSRDEQVLPLEDAVRRMTSLGCDRHGLAGRGRVRSGDWADLVLFDPSTVADLATYEDPKQESVGIRKVWVNGTLAFDDGVHLEARTGRILRAGEGG